MKKKNPLIEFKLLSEILDLSSAHACRMEHVKWGMMQESGWLLMPRENCTSIRRRTESYMLHSLQFQLHLFLHVKGILNVDMCGLVNKA